MGREGAGWEMLCGSRRGMRQATLGFAGKVRLLPDSEPAGEDSRHAMSPLSGWVVEEKSLRLMVVDRGLRLLVYPDANDLLRVTTKPVRLRVHAGERLQPTPERAMVELAGGVHPEVLARRDGWVEVAVPESADGLKHRGWIEEAELGLVFEDHGFPPMDGQEMRTKGPIALRAQPSAGDVWAELSEGTDVTVAKVVSDHALVTYRDLCSEFRLTGYVPMDQLEPSPRGGGGSGCGTIWLGGGDEDDRLEKTTLHAGRLLLAPGTTQVVGSVSQDIVVGIGDDGLYYAKTRWGPLGFDLAPIQERCAEAAVRTSRRQTPSPQHAPSHRDRIDG